MKGYMVQWLALSPHSKNVPCLDQWCLLAFLFACFPRACVGSLQSKDMNRIR